MNKSIKLAAISALALIGSVAAASAQAGGADTHGLPPSNQLGAKDQQTVPVKITTRDYDIKKLLSAPALSPEAKVGQVLWQQRCAYCHDGMGQPTYKTMGSWIDSDTVKAMGPDALKMIISTGIDRMPAFKYDLDAKQLDDVIEFLRTVPPSLKPTPAQLSGKAVAPNNNAE
jgi:mono/diheme cytochrome c family protein